MRHAWGIGLLLAALTASSDGQAREFALDEAQLRSAEISAVHPLPGGELAAVILEIEGAQLPIFVGWFEATAIERARRGLRPARPLTHDLLGSVIASADLELRRVVIDHLDDEGTYFAVLELKPRSGGEVQRIDARPSDAMALAVRVGAPIVVARGVIEKSQTPEPPAPTTLMAALVTESRSP